MNVSENKNQGKVVGKIEINSKQFLLVESDNTRWVDYNYTKLHLNELEKLIQD
ncbi:hypothetical protein [Bacillus thuringiensis]|uniref:hypothetical protein n=1 Tax=Bacillus thuringiensis TaxID=1428 RepID=UPI001596889B|nr:hypothetical protein [Bacillus thuringiensis]